MIRAPVVSSALRRVAALLLLSAVAACGPEAPPEGPPSIVLIVVDTLRADHLPFYGGARPTAPTVEREIARRGLVFERAYVQAPWTLPSMASMLTGADPGDLLDARGLPVGIPAGVRTLAERLAEKGYATAAAVANPTLHAEAGFARGFGRFEIVPFEHDSLRLDAREVNRRSVDWLASRLPEGPPFFLWAHYLDPHDPWTAPDAEPEAPFGLDCRERTVDGEDVHALYAEQAELGEPALDLACLEADYDAEIRWADARIGELLDAIPAGWRDRTLVVFTSDHGEEIADHGGWKHGETLYEEQIRVPLALRWPGRVPEAERRDEPVRLLDLAPTLLAAAGIDAADGLPGRDLLAPPSGPPPPILSRHLGPGPLRVAALRGSHKLILFDRHAPFEPESPLEEILWRRDVERLRRVEVYDLEADPGEERPGGLGDLPPGLEPRLLVRHLDRSISGLRLWLDHLPPGARLTGELRLRSSSPSDADPAADVSVPKLLFRGPEDRLERDGELLRLDVTADGLPRVLVFGGTVDGIRSGSLELDGRELPIRGPRGRRLDGPLEPEALVANGVPDLGPGPEARLWIRRSPRSPTRDAETARRLEALGYAG